jgi:hypothetical protein
LADFLPRAPLEPKGYKNIMNSPDWLARLDICAKLKKPCSGSRISIPDKSLFPYTKGPIIGNPVADTVRPLLAALHWLKESVPV